MQVMKGLQRCLSNAQNSYDISNTFESYIIFSFRQILLASTEMKAVMGVDPRPNCLIFDEIDGAPAASIELLLKFIQGKLMPKNKKEKRRSEKMSDGCIRPIVCICNELYTPSLR